MIDPGDDEWQVVPATEYFQPAAAVRDRNQILEWAKTHAHWSGSGKHIKYSDIKGKFHTNEVLGHGATGFVERVTFRSVTMARKKIRVRGMFVEQLREEANIMEKLTHRHIVELVGTYTHGQRDLYILTYPAATCNLQGFLDDIEEIRSSNSADITDAPKRFEALGFKGVSSSADKKDIDAKSLERPLTFLASILGCVTEAVNFVHNNGVRHQDLKPRNILISPRQVFLADFGISRDLRDATHSLTEGFHGGTPLYLAPEVMQGEKHHMSPADIYSLGCVFLTVASVLYAAPHGQYEIVMGEKDLVKKNVALREYLNDLRRRASRLGKSSQDASSCAPKHLIGLIESMLSQDPTIRPTACQVNHALYELGGIDQLYHGKCCQKDSFYISQIIDSKIRAASEGKNDQARKIQTLEAQHELDQQRIEQLEKTSETYKSLAERERKHAVEQYEKLLERRTRELEAAIAARKSLEAEVLHLRRQRQVPRSDKKGKGTYVPESIDSPSRFNAPPRRLSRVPLPVRPSTPLRPNYGRESSSGNNTLISSVNSAFSRTTAASNGSIDSAKSVRSSPPDSPISAKAPLSPPAVQESVGRMRRTWADIMKKPVAEISDIMKPLPNGIRNDGVLPIGVKT